MKRAFLYLIMLTIISACVPEGSVDDTAIITPPRSFTPKTTVALTDTPPTTRTSTPTPEPTSAPTLTATPTKIPTPTITPTPSPTAIGGGSGKIISSCSGHVPDRGIHLYNLDSGEYTLAHPDYEMSEALYIRDSLQTVSADGSQIAWRETTNRNVEFFGKYGARPESISKKFFISDADFLNKEPIPFSLPNNENFKGLQVLWFLDNKVLRLETDGTWDVDATWKYFLYLTDMNTGNSKLLKWFETPTLSGNPLQTIGLAASPDGKFIVIPYRQREGDENRLGLYLIDVMDETIQEIQLPGQPDVNIRFVEWHPQSDHFIFHNRKTSEIFDVSISDLSVSLLGDGRNPKFSPDGEWVLYEKEGELHIMSPDGSNDQVIDSQHNRRGIVGSSWGTNRNEIFYVDQIQSCCPALYRLRRVDLENNQVFDVMQFENEGSFDKGMQSLNWSPDRNWFLLLSWKRSSMGGYNTSHYLCNDESCVTYLPPEAESCYPNEWLGPYE